MKDMDSTGYWGEDQYKVLTPEDRTVHRMSDIMVNRSALPVLTMQGPYKGEAMFLRGR